jgi:hypothetical protein
MQWTKGNLGKDFTPFLDVQKRISPFRSSLVWLVGMIWIQVPRRIYQRAPVTLDDRRSIRETVHLVAVLTSKQDSQDEKSVCHRRWYRLLDRYGKAVAHGYKRFSIWFYDFTGLRAETIIQSDL